MNRFFLPLCLWLASASAGAAIDVYQFPTPAEEERFQALTEELRCPKCQNQSLHDSNAPIAKDLRQRTYELMQQGKSDEEIRRYMEARYGEFVSYRPALRPATVLLWAGPFLVFAVAATWFVVRLRRRAAAPAAAEVVTPPDVALVDDILRRFGDRDAR